MATKWESTAAVVSITGQQYPDGIKTCRFNKVIAEPSEAQLRNFGDALAALGKEDQLENVMLTVKKTITFA